MSGPLYGQPGPSAGGPFSLLHRILVCLVPLLTFGLLGMAPSVLLAVRRRRAVDVLGAVVFGLVQLTMYVVLGLSPKETTGTWYADVTGLTAIVLWLGAPAHFLIMDSAAIWGRGNQAVPAPWPPQGLYLPSPYPPGAPTQTAPVQQAPAYYQPQPQPQPQYQVQPQPQPQHPAQPQQVAPTPHPPTVRAAPGDDLQQLGELLRRQAGDGRP
ncbi:hypothetical protein [Kitasatospora sp. DSM 101779]|uniref:hypothetical protein n=1 Tax=Kitasatospora sp. DSM 101779 TaxID=2853165 RepID=UPI0021D8CC91|nr:hypothetical protein [Kitasatospora sp. DSM 101779]MCU7823125.1 hypothetical protein [Kitasatospora sp. DSM 101779]